MEVLRVELRSGHSVVHSARGECPTRVTVPWKRVAQKGCTRLWDERPAKARVSQCRARVSHKRVSSKSVLRVSCRVKQECPIAHVSYKRVTQPETFAFGFLGFILLFSVGPIATRSGSL